METNKHTRALQHLLVQGFTIYTCPAAVSLRLAAPNLLNDHPWACYMTSSVWPVMLLETDPLRQQMVDAAVDATQKDPKVLCHFEGTFLAMPLDVDVVRHAKARLEVAHNLGVIPTSLEGLSAVPDDVLALEIKRRKRAEEQEQARSNKVDRSK